MTYLDRLSNWVNKFKRYTVKYKNGAVHIHQLFNSPESMVMSYDNFFFCNHNKLKQLVTCNTLFLNAKIFYSELEEGLWIFVADVEIKKNIMFEFLYDKNLPTDFHPLNINIKTKSIHKKSLINGFLVKEIHWSLFKAGKVNSAYHYKDSQEKSITVFFTTKWFEKEKNINPELINRKLTEFLQSNHNFMISNANDNTFENIYYDYLKLVSNDIVKNTRQLKAITINLLNVILDRCEVDFESENHNKLSFIDQKNLLYVEKYLNDHLLGKFPGIENTAKHVGISPTKLKNDFKMMYKKTIYQHFSGQQMVFAFKLIQETDKSIKELANLLGYDNSSKFSERFKLEFGFLPSELRKKKELVDLEL